MWRMIRAELVKLSHPLIIVVAVVLCGFIWADARTTDHLARLQTPVAVSAVAQMQGAIDQACAAPTSSDCAQAKADAGLNQNFAGNAIALGRVTNALGTWPGLLRFTVHQLSTGLGWILLAVLISLHVAGEWSLRTSGLTLLASGSLTRLWVAKVASIWLWFIGLTVLTTTVLYLIRPSFNSTIGVPDPSNQSGDVLSWTLRPLPPDPVWSSWTGAGRALAGGALIWLVLAVVGVALATFVRRTVATLVVAMAGLSLIVLTGRVFNAAQFTPAPAISRLLQLGDTPFGVADTRLWFVPDHPSDIYAPRLASTVDWVALAGWVAGLVALGLLLMAGTRKRRVIA